MILAVERAAQKNLDFSEIFQYQYLVSVQQENLPGMQEFQIGRFFIHYGQKLHFARLFDRDKSLIGIVLGIAVDPSGLISGDHHLELSASSPDFFDQFEDYIEDVAGRYLFMINIEDEERIYLDPVGMIGCLYNRRTLLVGSSLSLCLRKDPVQNPLFDHRNATESTGRYSLFQTQDINTFRQNGSFYLDLSNFEETRFWPSNGSLEHDPKNYGKVYDQIIRHARHSIDHITANFNCAMPLSGGRDSRLIAAFAMPFKDRIVQYFTHITNYSTNQDNAISALIAEKIDIDHETHFWRDPEIRNRDNNTFETQIDQFQLAAGFDLQVSDEIRTNVQSKLKKHAVILRGHQTDILRAVFLGTPDKKKWKNFFWQIRKLRILEIKEYNWRVFRRYQPLYSNWYRTLPKAAREKQIDFMFLEIFYNSSLGLYFPAMHQHFYLSPFNSRKLIGLSLGFEDSYRFKGYPVDDIVYRIDPELCRIPYLKEVGPDLSEFQDRKIWEPKTQARFDAVKQRHRTYFK